MKPTDSLKAVERQAYSATFQDGIYDLLFGAIFLVCAWIPVMEAIGVHRYFLYPAFLVPILVLWLGKRYVTIPRLGIVEFGSKRKNRRRLIALIGVIAIVLMFPLVLMQLADGFADGKVWLLMGLIAAPVFAIAVIFMDFSRMYVYGAWLFFAIVESEYLLRYFGEPYNLVVSFGLPGVVITGYGLMLLIRFLATHPKQTTEMPHVSR